MAVDLDKLQKRFDELFDDPNFPADFEEWLEKHRATKEKSEVNVNAKYIHSLSIEKKHEIAAAFFASIKLRDFSAEYKETMDFLKKERLRIFKENEEEHGYAGSEFLAAKHVLSIIYMKE